MKKEIRCNCGLCNSVIETYHVCDICGVNLEGNYFGIPYIIECSYGSHLDGTEYHFCSLICMKSFVDSELNKGVENA